MNAFYLNLHFLNVTSTEKLEFDERKASERKVGRELQCSGLFFPNNFENFFLDVEGLDGRLELAGEAVNDVVDQTNVSWRVSKCSYQFEFKFFAFCFCLVVSLVRVELVEVVSVIGGQVDAVGGGHGGLELDVFRNFVVSQR